MDTEEFIRSKLAREKRYRVTTVYADGGTRTHDVHSLGQADNYALVESRKIGRDLIDRQTGKTVRVTDVVIEPLF